MSTAPSRLTTATSSTYSGTHQATTPRRLTDGNYFSCCSYRHIYENTNTLTEYQVWVCYKVATHQLNLYFPSRETDSTCKRHLACAGQHVGLLHNLWDCIGATKFSSYIIVQWTRSKVSSAQMVLYKQAALSRSAPELPPRVRADIKHMFPDTADTVGRAWKRIWWIACSVCVTTLWIQRNRSIHKQESASTEQEVAEVKQVCYQ